MVLRTGHERAGVPGSRDFVHRILLTRPAATAAAHLSIGGPPPYASSEVIKEPEEVAPLALFLATQPDRGPTAQSFSLTRRPM